MAPVDEILLAQELKEGEMPEVESSSSPKIVNMSMVSRKSGKSSILSYEPVIPVKKGWITTIKKIMNPPIYATLFSIPCGLIPYLKEYVFSGSGAVLTNNVFSALVSMGGTVSPLICILLGSKLSKGYPPTAKISK
jgi:predicted permease